MEDGKLICHLLEMIYEERMGIKKSENQNYSDGLYPMNWYANKNYENKILILTEAIEKQILIINTDGYQNVIEGIARNY
jgi:hypothetical protein